MKSVCADKACSYDTPGLTLARLAHVDLEGLVMDSKVRSLRDRFVSFEWSQCLYNGKLFLCGFFRCAYLNPLLGMYFSPEREFLQNSIEFSQRQVDGKVHLMAYKGNAYVLGRSSETSNLYSETESSMDTLEGFSPEVSDDSNKKQAPLCVQVSGANDGTGYHRIHCHPGHSPGEVRREEDSGRRAHCPRVDSASG